jgi:hypothetical protein
MALGWQLKNLMLNRVTCVLCLLKLISLLDPESKASHSNDMQLLSILPDSSDSEHDAVLLNTRFILFTVLDPPNCCCWEDLQSKIVPIFPCGTMSLMLRTDQIALAELRSAAGDEDLI